MSNEPLLHQSDATRKPEFLHNSDEQVAWVPVRSQRFNADARQFEPCEITRGQAKQAALHEVTSYYEWNTLRCTKVWMVWDDEFTDPETGWRGCWVEAKKTDEGAQPYWRVEETHKL